MARIKQLSQHTINQIAAGEVIERPASVIKELVENSIDAGATRISVDVSNECRNIRVADNGSGIHPDDIVLAFSKHATSKIDSGEDLYNIHTLGFRGEALASIISIAKVTCTTRTKDYDYGTKVECENSEVKYSQTGCAIGTIMEIRDLFHNIPVRLKFLKTEKTEFAYISELVTAIAISNPNIAIELKLNGKTSLKTTGVGGLENVIKTLFSKTILDNLKPVSNNDKISKISISGYASTPDFTRTNKKDYHIFVNNRTVKCPAFIKAIDTAYKNSLPHGKYPFLILNLIIPPEDVDVNVHPTKKEIRYKNPNQIFNFIRTSVNAGLANYSYNNSVISQPAETYTKKDNIAYIHENNSELPQITYKDDEFMSTSIINQERISKAFEEITEYQKKTYYENSNENPHYDVKHELYKQQELIKKEHGNRENIIGQYKHTYILIDNPNGLEIVDQHIADERYIYETLKKQHEPMSQTLFISDVLQLEAEEAELIKNNLIKFDRFGYGIEFISETEIIFKKIPQLLSRYNPRDILKDILANIDGDINNLEEKILITTACKAAIKANTPLNLFQMEEIIKNWRNCQFPYTCPHGRPISKIIKHNDLANFFMRSE